MEFSSKLIETAVTEISKLPGIGKKTALRLALHLLKSEQFQTEQLANALVKLRNEIVYCEKCFNISDDNICGICSSIKRDKNILCIVEDIRDILAIENTGQYTGLYHVLGGVISPIEGVGPEQLNISALVQRVQTEPVKEIIFALSPTMEGDTTTYYISKKIKALDIKTSSIARGIPIGGDLEYTDEITLGRSILTRTNYTTE